MLSLNEGKLSKKHSHTKQKKKKTTHNNDAKSNCMFQSNVFERRETNVSDRLKKRIRRRTHYMQTIYLQFVSYMYCLCIISAEFVYIDCVFQELSTINFYLFWLFFLTFIYIHYYNNTTNICILYIYLYV